jgi:multidrug efflux pump subunit AcrB
VSDPIETEAPPSKVLVRVSSKSRIGLSLVEVEFTYDVSVDLAAVDVQNAVAG